MRYAVVHTYTGEIITRCDSLNIAIQAQRFHQSCDAGLASHYRKNPLEVVDTSIHSTTSAGTDLS